MQLLDFMFQDLPHFLGCMVLLGVILGGGGAWLKGFGEWLNVRKHGWPK